MTKITLWQSRYDALPADARSMIEKWGRVVRNRLCGTAEITIGLNHWREYVAPLLQEPESVVEA